MNAPLTAGTPKPPYYAVIFSSQRADDDAAYSQMAMRMEQLAAQQPGYLGHENSRDEHGFGITVSYWSDEESIRQWKRHAEHLLAQKQGRSQWYSEFKVRVARVERDYGMRNDE